MKEGVESSWKFLLGQKFVFPVFLLTKVESKQSLKLPVCMLGIADLQYLSALDSTIIV